MVNQQIKGKNKINRLKVEYEKNGEPGGGAIDGGELCTKK